MSWKIARDFSSHGRQIGLRRGWLDDPPSNPFQAGFSLHVFCWWRFICGSGEIFPKSSTELENVVKMLQNGTVVKWSFLAVVISHMHLVMCLAFVTQSSSRCVMIILMENSTTLPPKPPGSVYIWSSFVTSNSIFPGPSVPLSSTVYIFYIRIIVGENNRNSSKPKVWMAHFGEDFQNLIPHVDINCSSVLALQNKNSCTPRATISLPADLLHATAPCQANLPTRENNQQKSSTKTLNKRQ